MNSNDRATAMFAITQQLADRGYRLTPDTTNPGRTRMILSKVLVEGALPCSLLLRLQPSNDREPLVTPVASIGLRDDGRTNNKTGVIGTFASIVYTDIEFNGREILVTLAPSVGIDDPTIIRMEEQAKTLLGNVVNLSTDSKKFDAIKLGHAAHMMQGHVPRADKANPFYDAEGIEKAIKGARAIIVEHIIKVLDPIGL